MAKRVADLLVDVLVDAAIKRVYCVSVDSLEGITDSGSAARMEGASEAGFCSYYATDYFGRYFCPDTTDTAHPGTIIGYNGPGSPNTNHRATEH